VAVEAPAWGLLSLFLVFSFIFLTAWQVVFRSTLGPALRKLGGVGFGGVHGIGAVHPLRFLTAIADKIDAATTRGLQGSERGVVYSFNKFIDTAALFIGVPLAIALALLELAQWASHQVGKAVTRVEHTTVIKKITTTGRVVTEVTRVQFNKLTARVDALAARVTHFAHVAAGAAVLPFPRIGRIEKTVKAQGKRLTRVEKLLAAGVGVALLTRTLAKLGLGWLRCSNVNKAGKAVCGMNPLALEALLLNAAALTVAFNLEDFARELQTVTGEAARLIHNFAD
jgi:hypothetical protein